MVIKLIPPPTVDAGGIRYVLKDHTITLNPTVSDENVTYNWSPNINISSTTIKNPVITGDIDRIYTLTVTDSRGCISPVSQTFIRVSPVIDVPNTFTPNGDGFNDKWEIAGLVAYENCTVDIFNRYGTKLFHSKGYPTPWDGKYSGALVPPGVYYYIIDTKMNGKVITGNVTIIR
jgi:gliding motility-associated-like protein